MKATIHFAIPICFLLCYTGPAAAETDATLAARLARGRAAYMNCAACHGMDGKGLPSTPPMAPALAGSKLANGPAEIAAVIALKGIQKMDAKYLGAMGSTGATLTDDQLADVLTYIRSSWGNKGSAVTSGEIKTWREKYKEINSPLPRTAYEKKAAKLESEAAPDSRQNTAPPATEAPASR